MSHFELQPRIRRSYCRYLEDLDVAGFVRSVASDYTLATLHRLADHGDRVTRRSAFLAMSLIGGEESIAALGHGLRDSDRGVRMIAEDGLLSIWSRGPSAGQRGQLDLVACCNAAARYAEAHDVVDQILAVAPQFGHAWYLRCKASAGMGFHSEAIADGERALEFEPMHFLAAWAMADCYVEEGELSAAVSCLQWALRIHPHLESARVQLRRLKRVLREQTDY